ncbi:hypothetical protein Tco_1156280 [Tanacetum coccineum]
MCSMIIKIIEMDGMAHERNDDLKVDLKVLEEHLIDYQESDCLVEEMSTKSFLGGIRVSLIFFVGLDDEACVEAMEVEEEKCGEDDNENEERDHYLIKT